MRLLKSIFFIFLFSVSVSAQWENDGKGISYKQLYGCQDTAGVKLDSMFRMTDTTGKLTVCISIEDLIDIINNYGGDGGGGSGSFDCDSVENCLADGVLCEVLKTFGTASYGADDKVFGVNGSGMCRQFDLNLVTGVGDTVRIVNNADGSYTLINENGTNFQYGYMLNCINDSTFALTDWDGTPVDTCIIKGGVNGSIPPLNCDSVAACVNTFLCDSVLACLNEGVLCDALQALEDADTEEGQRYVTITPGGECVLTDSIYIDICGILDQIQDESDLMEDDIAFILRGENCYKVEISTRATNCIDVSIDAGDIIAVPIMDPSPPTGYTQIYCGSEGMYGAPALLEFNCDSLHKLFNPGATADSIFATNGGDCVKIPFPGTAAVNCDTMAAIFAVGTYNDNDRVLAFDGGTGECESYLVSNFSPDCDDIHDLFATGDSDPDSLLAFKSGACVSVALEEIDICSRTLPHWELGSCEEPRIVVQCGTECRYMTPCDIQDYVCSGLRSPFSPTELGRAVEVEVAKQLSFKPSELTDRAALTDYPTVNNVGIRTFKNKRQAELSDIPVGGIYYIEGKGNLMVKTRNRKR